MKQERSKAEIEADLSILVDVKKKLFHRTNELKKIIYTLQSDIAIATWQADELQVAQEKMKLSSEELHFVQERLNELNKELEFAERGKISGKKFGF